ncbi:Biopterin transport-related protein BT1 [Cynara cardunculus var. scolymus]|uniref:Biopterin transport-related protein BT1 n=2 Tax=Cynara cardunculus var. scolymus TaxID=59895 RepID=A0A103XQN5_CYNCS|nr:Biopterin transport-related protein BT1 [Cynara cardunculus var. scolymus]
MVGEGKIQETHSREEQQVEGDENGSPKRGILMGCCNTIRAPIDWFRMLSKETHWSLVGGVVAVYGINQGFGGALARVGTEYYMKDVQKVQPSEAQAYKGITNIPWIIKPIWGLLTDVVPIFGYRRRPYFVLAGILGILSMFFLSFHEKLHIVLALVCLTVGSGGVAIADVTVDACVAQQSGIHPSLAPDMQSLCALSSSIGALIGFSLSGVFVHLIGPKGVYGLLSIPFALVLLVGLVLKEPHSPSFAYRQINEKFLDAASAMWTTLKCQDVWRPCLYMYLSFALSLNIYEGLFYWETDSKAGPSFSQETIGFILSIGSVGSLLGAILYQYGLKTHPFRALLFWTQLFFGLSGMLDLVFILRLNLKLGLSDYFFAVIDESVFQLVGRLKWMPLLVLSSQLCPPGIEGTFFALLMSIDNFGLMSSTWLGGLLLHVLNVTRTQFDNLWLAILIRNVLRIVPLAFLFLVPKSSPESSGFSRMEVLSILEDGESHIEVSGILEDSELSKSEEVELTPLVSNIG